MSHEIWQEKFVAVRRPAWHQLGQLAQDDLTATQAATEVDLLYTVSKYPLMAQTPAGPVSTGLTMVGRQEDDGTMVNYGVAAEFDLVMLEDVLPNLDELTTRYPLSAAGALKKGAAAFFTFTVSESSEVAGEEYQEYLTVVHSYAPGVAHKFIYSPVRVVCMNTLVAADDSATGRVAVSHNKKSAERLDAAYLVSTAMAQASVIKKNLEVLAATTVSEEQVTKVLEASYKMYRPTAKLDAMVEDLVGEDTMMTLMPKRESQERYYQSMMSLGNMAFERFNEEQPKLANTAYALLQSVIEVSDFRRGRDTVGTAEASLIGTKAQEKKAAYKAVMSLAS